MRELIGLIFLCIWMWLKRAYCSVFGHKYKQRHSGKYKGRYVCSRCEKLGGTFIRELTFPTVERENEDS